MTPGSPLLRRARRPGGPDRGPVPREPVGVLRRRGGRPRALARVAALRHDGSGAGAARAQPWHDPRDDL